MLISQILAVVSLSFLITFVLRIFRAPVLTSYLIAGFSLRPIHARIYRKRREHSHII